MKFSKIILISIFLLAIITLGAASAADDLNTEIGGGKTAMTFRPPQLVKI